jgi:group I intron endonuclease
MEAYQYKIRCEKSQTEIIDFDINNVKLSNTTIKLIDKQTATNIIIEYEWLKSMPFIVKYCFGIFFNINGNEILGGVLVFSNDYADNTGVWDKYGFTNKLLLLSRGVCLWWTPKNTASYFISKTCKWIKNNTEYKIITATVDPAAGEIGTIYQALNWNYIGIMTGNYYHNRESKRFGVYIDGKLRTSRWIRNKLGTMKKNEILKIYPNAQFVNQYRKRRYFFFIDNKIRNNEYYNAIKQFILPYPKRDINIIGIIYMINNKINNKKYIGQTTRAFNDRINDYKNGFGNEYINKSFIKYGWDNFEFSIIDAATSIDELNTKEIKYINQYKSNNRDFGYNIEAGGKNSIPIIETLEKMSRAHIGIKQTNEWIEKRIAKMGSIEAKKYGKFKTEEDKLDLSHNSPKYWQGKNRDVNTKKKISQTKKINGLSEKQKNIICKKVFKINSITNEIIKIYASTAEASIFENINQSTISRRCKNNKIVKNILWKY